MPTIPAGAVPAVSAAQMAEVDRLAVDVYGITLLQMMEQAGSHLAEVAAAELGGELGCHRIVVAVGPGNNGGGGLAAARHLTNRGARVRVVLARPARRLGEAGRHQLATLLEMGVSCCMAVYDISDAEIDEELARADIIIDAVLGYRGRGAPHDEVAALLDRIRVAEDRLRREINPTVFRPSEIQERLRASDHFISRTLSGSKIMLIGTEDDIEQLARTELPG